MADSYRLLNWSSPATPARLFAPQPVALPAAVPAPAPVPPAMAQDAWVIPDLAALTSPAVMAPPAAPPAPKPKAAKPKPKPAPAPPKKPAADPGARYAKELRSHLHGKYYKTPTGCFRYAWNLVALSGGRSIGRATQSREARGRGTAHLAQLVKNGRIQVGDIVYINKKPGADPTSTILSYKPHWFIYIGNGQFADQYGERDAAGMDRMLAGRKIDTIYRTR